MFAITKILDKLGLLSAATRGRKSTSSKSVPLRLEALEDRMVPATVANPTGGPIIPNVHVQSVYYGSVWSDPNAANYPQLKQEANDLDKFLGTIVGSDYMNGLSQYRGVAYKPMSFGTATLSLPVAATPGKGSFLGRDAAALGALNANGNLNESTIVNSLKQEIASGKLQKPDYNTLYMVFLPPGVRSQVDVTKGFGGHHAVFASSNGPAYYAIIEHGSLSNPGTFQQLTVTASHELVESVTNPADWDRVDSPANNANNPAWLDKAGNEIGDIAQNSPPASGLNSVVDGYVVTKYWSEKDKTSIAPSGTDVKALTDIPTELTGAHFTMWTLQPNGQRSKSELQISYITLGVSGSQPNFTGYWKDANGQLVEVEGRLSVVGSTVSVWVNRKSDKLRLLTGTLSTPNGYWRSGVEVSGTNANGFALFGVEDDGSLTPVTSSGSGPTGVPTPPPHKGPILFM
jgi:hypothetical protein